MDTGAMVLTTAVESGMSRELLTAAGIVVIVILVGLSAFFSSSEIAMFSLARHRLDTLIEEGRPRARTVKELKDDPHRLLITILVGNNLVNIAMSSIATGLLALYMTQGQAVAIATLSITAVVLLFGESAPKSYAVENAESWSLVIARPLKYSEYALYPLIVVFDYLTKIVNKVTGGRSAIETSYVTRDEIQTIIETGEREGVIDRDEYKMLRRIFRFDTAIAKEVMTPRLDVNAIPANASIDEAIEICVQTGHTRLPVYDSSLDNVFGVVSITDLVRERDYSESERDNLDSVIQPTLHVPESKNADDLLEEMQAERIPMVIVIDEFGTTEGLITIEDMIEEIVGDILDEDEAQPIEIDDDDLFVRGEVNIDQINDELEIDLPEGEEFETLAGFIFNRAGRLVEEGEEIEYGSLSIRIDEVDSTRIVRARIYHRDGVDEQSDKRDVDN